MKPPRVRIAPSPTGFVHIGTLRTALYNYLFAKKHGGELILRIEDTDRSRFVPGAVQNLLETFSWAGTAWDEGPLLNTDTHNTLKESADEPKEIFNERGEKGPYVQSQRTQIYREHAQKLLDSGHAYYCFCSAERLEQMRKDQMARKEAPKYDRTCLGLSSEEVQHKIDEGLPHVMRLKMPDKGECRFTDEVRGVVGFLYEAIDDQVLMKSDGFPTYHLANVVDDHLMGITHVIRGEEWLSSTPKHIALYEAFGWKVPTFAHLPLILNKDKTKLSKRQGDVSVSDYIEKGYLKEALINFIVFLGWHPGKGQTREIYSLKELEQVFDLHGVHKAGAVLDIDKLNWMNAQYIKQMSIEELYSATLPFLQKQDFYKHADEYYKHKEYLLRVLEIEQERLERLDGVGEDTPFFFSRPTPQKGLIGWKGQTSEETKTQLEKAQDVLSRISDTEWTRKNLEKTLMDAAGDKRGDFLWPLRAALTAEKKSPPPFDVAWVLGREESAQRIADSIQIITQ